MSPEDFKAGMRRFPAAVSVITAEHGGARAGMTATAVMSLTAEPPQLAVALNRSASALPSVLAAGAFAINTLAYDQDAVGNRFAGAGGLKGEQRFEGAEWTTLETGAPVLLKSAVSFDCRLAATHEIDTHILLVGEVVAVQLGESDRQLLYVDGGWAGLAKATKDDVERYLGAVRRAVACIDEAQTEHAEPLRQLHAFVRAFAEFHLELDRDVEALQGLEPLLSRETLAGIKAAKAGFDEKLRGLLTGGVASGAFHIANVALTAQTITGMTSWVSRWHKSSGLSRGELGERLCELVDVTVGAGALAA
ncbi:MAG: transcriptional regulator, TetR family protein [Caulobacter sp.]|nr:transcriptional regulator, TetR family protein [Caulobacter sp.]